jgi:hypothetical protein
MKELLKRIFMGETKYDSLIEGVMAHQYPEMQQDQIRKDYLTRWSPKPQVKTPHTDPCLFDPCEPPDGWVYDPYYEIWIKLNE